MVLGSSKTLVNFFSQCAKQCATLCPWNGIKSLSFLCPPLGRSQHVRKSGARAPFGQRKVSDGPHRGSGRSKNLVCGRRGGKVVNVPVIYLPYMRAIIVTHSYLPLCPHKLLFYFANPGRMVPQQFF